MLPMVKTHKKFIKRPQHEMKNKKALTDTECINSCVLRGQYSDKMKSSTARYVAWTLPCGLSVTYSPLFLGRISVKAIVEYWGGGTSEFITLQDE